MFILNMIILCDILEILTLFIDFIMPKCIILVLLIMIEYSIQKVSNTFYSLDFESIISKL